MTSILFLVVHLWAALAASDSMMKCEDAKLWALPTTCLIAWYLYYGATTFAPLPNLEVYLYVLEVASCYSIIAFSAMAACGGGLQTCHYLNS